jgi:hypothetical protein
MVSKQVSGTSDGGFALRFSAMVDFLAVTTDGSQKSIESRFRKLRPKLAADNLLTTPGIRVEYDLTRILAIGSIYSLNALGLAQGHAVDIVVGNWPEIARGCIAAWRRQVVALATDDESHSHVCIYVDAFDEGRDGRDTALASWATNDASDPVGLPHVLLDCNSLITALSRFAEAGDQDIALGSAFEELGVDFSPPAAVPQEIAGKTGSAFFSTGPFFGRARAILESEPGRKLSRRKGARLQAFLRYLEAPPSIDAWKAIIGRDASAPRLHQMLGAWGVRLGLQSSVINGETLVDAAFDKAGALSLIASGEARLAELLLKVSGKRGETIGS